MRKLLLVTCVGILIVLVGCGEKASITLNKSVYAPGKDIQVSFVASADWSERAWIGVIPANIQHGDESVNDAHDIAYQYIDKRTSGVFTFRAPGQAGTYDFRMHDTDADGKEIVYVSFEVKPMHEGSSLELKKEIFSPGEKIEVVFVAPEAFASDAWVGIIPSDIPHGRESTNDEHDLVYQYLSGKTGGKLTFTAPKESGSYDFRMHDTDYDGNEAASVTFSVK